MLKQLDLFGRSEDLEEIASTDLKYLLVPAFQGALTMKQIRADDERVREYYLLRLRRWIAISLEEIESIDQEIKILRERDPSRQASASNASRLERPPMKPFILTRNTAQAKVFGAGYRSLATMTVSDWYEQHRKYGALPDEGIVKETPEEELRKAAQQQENQEKQGGRR
ncbi:Immunoglobulin-binding protein 1 [Plecturocebus cupreus]